MFGFGDWYVVDVGFVIVWCCSCDIIGCCGYGICIGIVL